jgi:hypothetical protein
LLSAYVGSDFFVPIEALVVLEDGKQPTVKEVIKELVMQRGVSLESKI